MDKILGDWEGDPGGGRPDDDPEGSGVVALGPEELSFPFMLLAGSVLGAVMLVAAEMGVKKQFIRFISLYT